ncbi:sigma-70 family RNA polymerase sigma factor [Chryseobacterium sp. SSA4.19]|uniref:RNA polymerase sigma factor n=1 Tax=Chryseobacterium sp. SSA4.19 TaxID=2919915 RepID=UPI001F4D6786|nr:sigma-70 family RNA polymerase sigma factor [Chryseobacterium sp. SSA4.19]MCJ8153185.1 sigma-70 family RNA polymerase sigma factor [Chryseobacterium sp. SSA4.19]
MSQNNWQKIYLDYSPKLLGICRRYIQDIYTAEDIVQDSFIIAIQKKHQLNDEKALFAWLKKIVVNNALQHIRRQSKETFVISESLEIPDTASEMAHHHSEEKNIFIYDFTHEELLSSIDSLPPHHKSVFNMYFIENYSHAEISNTLGITVNTSKSHLLRAKKSVQNYLLNHIVRPHTPKKKFAQLLVIFGLGGLLWAQTFRSRFSDFRVSPSRTLQIPSDIEINPLSYSSSKSIRKSKIIIAGTLALIIIMSVFLLNPGNSFSMHSYLMNSKNFSKKLNETAPETNKNEKTQVEISVLKGEEKENSTQPISSDHQMANISEAEVFPVEKNIENRNKSKKIILKDSIKEAPQKIIIVKKIIKRDTVFIER